MKEPYTLAEFFEMYRNQFGYGFVAAAVAVSRQWMAGHPFRLIVGNGVICAAVAFGVETVLEACGIAGGKWSYMASVFVGYVGVEAFFAGLADRFPQLTKFLGGKNV